jgi:MOSC domain-containing protein YiiM
MNGSIIEIHIATVEGGPTTTRSAVELITGSGIVGDRYFDFDEDGQVTLVDADTLDAVNAETGWAITPAQTRRNIVTRGIDLNQWETSRFQVGDAILQGVELCEPCGALGALLQNESRNSADVVKALLNKGGLRARIIKGATVQIGDRVSSTA